MAIYQRGTCALCASTARLLHCSDGQRICGRCYAHPDNAALQLSPATRLQVAAGLQQAAKYGGQYSRELQLFIIAAADASLNWTRGRADGH